MSVLKNLGYIQKAQWYGCAEPNPTLIIQAAGTAFFPVLINAITFGCIDIIKMRAGISPWHARNMKALIGGAIPPAQTNAINKLYKYVVPLEKVLFFWFVVDLTDQFLANWHSEIFKLGACGFDVDKCSWSGDRPGWTSPGMGLGSTVAYETTAKENPKCSTFGFGFSVPAGWYWSAFFDVTPRPIIHDDVIGNVETWIQKRNPTIFNYPKQKFEPKWYSNQITATYMMDGHNKHDVYEEYWFMASCDVAATAISGSACFSASSVPLTNDGIVPVNCFGAPIPTAGNPS